MVNEGERDEEKKGSEVFLKLCKNTRKSIWPKYFSVCSKAPMWLWQLRALPHCAQAVYCIKLNLKASFMPEDMQEHEVKLTVLKTSLNWQKNNFSLHKAPAIHNTALGQVSNQNMQSAFPCQSSYDSSHYFRIPLYYKRIDLSGHSAQTQNCCVPAPAKCKAVIKKTKQNTSSPHPKTHPITHQVKALWANTCLLCQ